jgi:4-amino-4-deoxy-L-arabinose transferase-like glycosyltransferase
MSANGFLSNSKKSKRNNLDSISVAIGCVLYLVLILFWSAKNGALGIPRNDDAFYIRTAFHFAETGKFVPVSSYPTLFGQVLFSYPIIQIFGESISALQIFVSALGVFALFVLYLLLRNAISKIHSVICVLILGLSPIFANISISYMTDIPAFSFQIFSLFFIAKLQFARKHNSLYFSAAALTAFVAFSIRQSGVTAVVTVFVMGLIATRSPARLRKSIFLVNAVVLGGTAFVFYYWRSLSPLYKSYPISWDQFANPVRFVATSLATIGMTYGLYLLPVLFLVSPRKFYLRYKGSYFISELLVVLSVVITFVILRPKPIGNYFSRFVPYAATVNANTSDVLSGREWQLLQVIGLVTTLIFLVVILRWSRQSFKNRSINFSGTSIIGISFVITIGFMAFAFEGGGFDRYGLILIPLLPAMLIKCSSDLSILRNRFSFSALAALLLIAVFGVKSFDSSTVFDGAKWKIANQEVKSGTNPLHIDGGYEWFAYHQTNFDTTQIDKFVLWGKFSSDPEKLTPEEMKLVKDVCIVARVNKPEERDEEIRKLEETGLFGWKVQLALQKLWECG